MVRLRLDTQNGLKHADSIHYSDSMASGMINWFAEADGCQSDVFEARYQGDLNDDGIDDYVTVRFLPNFKCGETSRKSAFILPLFRVATVSLSQHRNGMSCYKTIQPKDYLNIYLQNDSTKRIKNLGYGGYRYAVQEEFDIDLESVRHYLN
jgi:hypothetical protein